MEILTLHSIYSTIRWTRKYIFNDPSIARGRIVSSESRKRRYFVIGIGCSIRKARQAEKQFSWYTPTNCKKQKVKEHKSSLWACGDVYL